jgi:hypothetical protein
MAVASRIFGCHSFRRIAVTLPGGFYAGAGDAVRMALRVPYAGWFVKNDTALRGDTSI